MNLKWLFSYNLIGDNNIFNYYPNMDEELVKINLMKLSNMIPYFGFTYTFWFTTRTNLIYTLILVQLCCFFMACKDDTYDVDKE